MIKASELAGSKEKLLSNDMNADDAVLLYDARNQ
jgi:hypothetical protein